MRNRERGRIGDTCSIVDGRGFDVVTCVREVV